MPKFYQAARRLPATGRVPHSAGITWPYINIAPHKYRPMDGETLRYDVTVEMTYLAGHDHLPEDARAALHSAIAANFDPGKNADVTLTALTVRRHDSAVEIRATLRGNRPIDLTSPIDAVTRVDTAICQSLMQLGLYEEFDVASRSLKAAPANRNGPVDIRP
jgi:hypothetical protein